MEAVQKHVEHAPEHVERILAKAVHDLKPRYNPDPPAYTSRFPDLSGPDPMVIAKQLRETLGFNRGPHAMVGGNVFSDLSDKVSSLTSAFDPSASARSGIHELNRVNFKDTSARGVARNMLHGYAGYLHGQATYAKSQGLLLAPLSMVSGGVPTGAMMAVGAGSDKLGDTAGTIARTI